MSAFGATCLLIVALIATKYLLFDGGYWLFCQSYKLLASQARRRRLSRL